MSKKSINKIDYLYENLKNEDLFIWNLHIKDS